MDENQNSANSKKPQPDFFLLDSIEIRNTSYVSGIIVSLSNMIKTCPPLSECSDEITNPYSIPKANTAIDIMISFNTMTDQDIWNSVLAMLGLAKMKNIIVRTTASGTLVTGYAGILAVHGTKGFRIMYEGSVHFIDFNKLINQSAATAPKKPAGFSSGFYSRAGDSIQEHKINFLKNIYIQNTKLTNDTFDNPLVLTPEQCLEYKVCDWVLTSEGKLIGNTGR